MPNIVILVLAFLSLLLLLFCIRRERRKLTLTAVSLFSVWSRIGGQDGAPPSLLFSFFQPVEGFFGDPHLHEQSLVKRDIELET